MNITERDLLCGECHKNGEVAELKKNLVTAENEVKLLQSKLTASEALRKDLSYQANDNLRLYEMALASISEARYVSLNEADKYLRNQLKKEKEENKE